MEYQIELSPLQIKLNLEVYHTLNKLFDLKINEKEIEKIKNGIQIVRVDKESNLTTIRVSYKSEILKGLLIKKIAFLFEEKNLEKNIGRVYTYIFKKANNETNFPKIENFIPYYLRETCNTLLIDIFCEHFAELIHYIIKMLLREEHNKNEVGIISNNILNHLLLNMIDISFLDKFLKGKYWISSRHLGLVNNTWEPLSHHIQKPEKKNSSLKSWISSNIPDMILDNFKNYYRYLSRLNNYKIIDAQMQIQSAFILKRSIENLIIRKNVEIDYIYGTDLDNLLKMIIRN